MRKGITVDHVSFWVDFTKFNVNMSGFSESQCRSHLGLVLEASFAPRILKQIIGALCLPSSPFDFDVPGPHLQLPEGVLVVQWYRYARTLLLLRQKYSSIHLSVQHCSFLCTDGIYVFTKAQRTLTIFLQPSTQPFHHHKHRCSVTTAAQVVRQKTVPQCQHSLLAHHVFNR